LQSMQPLQPSDGVRARSPARIDLMLPLLLISLGILQLLFVMDNTMDDAYITLHFARNLVQGNGITWYGPDGYDAVEGVTTFSWLLILAFFYLLTPAFAMTLAKAAGVVCWVATSWLVVREVRRRHDLQVAWIAAAPLMVGTPIIVHAVSGMETSLAMLLVLLAHLFACRALLEGDRRFLVPLALATLLACMTRPDYAVCFVATVVGAIVVRRRLPSAHEWLALAACLVLPGIVYFAWRWSYFGYPLPNTFYIKATGVNFEALVSVVSFFPFLALPCFFGVSLVAARQGPGRRRALLAIISFLPPVLAWLNAAPTMGIFWRFLVPYFAILPVAFADFVALPHMPLRTWRATVSLSLVVPLLSAPLVILYVDKYVPLMYVLSDVAGVLREVDDRGQYTLAWGDAGVIPYESGWKTLDTYALCDERIAHGAVENAEARVLEVQPDVLMMYRGPVVAERFRAAEWANYTRVGPFPLMRGAGDRELDLAVYVRSDSPAAQAVKNSFESFAWHPVRVDSTVLSRLYQAVRTMYRAF
jgi:arabinofuranosyltransferase